MTKRPRRVVAATAALAAVCLHASGAAGHEDDGRGLPPGITAFEDFNVQQQYVVFVDQCGGLEVLSSGPAAIWTGSPLFPAGVYAPGSQLVSTYQPLENDGHVLFLAGDGEPRPGDLVDAYGAPPGTLVDVTAAAAVESPGAVRRHYEACGQEIGGFELRNDVTLYYAPLSPWYHEFGFIDAFYTGSSGALHNAYQPPSSTPVWHDRVLPSLPGGVPDHASLTAVYDNYAQHVYYANGPNSLWETLAIYESTSSGDVLTFSSLETYSSKTAPFVPLPHGNVIGWGTQGGGDAVWGASRGAPGHLTLLGGSVLAGNTLTASQIEAPHLHARSPTLAYVLPTVPYTPVMFYVGDDRRIYVFFGGSVTPLTQPGQTLPSEHRLQGGANVLAGYYDFFVDGLVLYYVGEDGFIYEYRRPVSATSWTWEVVGGGNAAH